MPRSTIRNASSRPSDLTKHSFCFNANCCLFDNSLRIFDFLFLCPCFVHGKERGRNPFRVSREALEKPVRYTEDNAPSRTHSSLRRLVQVTFQVSLGQPKRRTLKFVPVLYHITALLAIPYTSPGATSRVFRETGLSSPLYVTCMAKPESDTAVPRCAYGS